MKTLVIYHDNCADGFTAAWAAWKVLGEEESGTEYRAYQHGDDPPTDAAEFNNIYILDFSFKSNVLVKLAEQVKEKVVLIDHHKTAQADLAKLMAKGLPFGLVVTFDMEKSGAMLAWEHFHPKAAVPELVKYVQDRDLWHWEMPHSREVSMVLQTTDFDFPSWDMVATRLEDGRVSVDNIVREGRAILTYQDTMIKRACEDPGFIIMGSYRVPCVNAPNWQSEIGNVLAKDHLFAVMWFMNKEGYFVYSLRSDKDRASEVADVSAIAEQLGGGGHRHAAGFRSLTPPELLRSGKS